MLVNLLVIVSAAAGLYFLLKPPAEGEAQADLRTAASVAKPYKGVAEASSVSVKGTAR